MKGTRALHHARLPLLLGLLVLGMLASGCATRKEVVQFQRDHQEIRARLETLDAQADRIERRTDRLVQIQADVDTLLALLGGNVSEYLRDQEDILRAMRAEQNAVNQEMERLILTLSSRVDETEERLQRMIITLDTFNQLVGQALSDSLAGTEYDAAEAQRLFQQSYSDYLQGQMEVARMGFRQYVKQYPTTTMADDALYWVGETYLGENASDSARAAFRELEDRYPESNRLPTALLKRAILRIEEGQYGGARRLLRQVIDRFPRTDEAEQARIRLEDLKGRADRIPPPDTTAVDTTATGADTTGAPSPEPVPRN